MINAGYLLSVIIWLPAAAAVALLLLRRDDHVWIRRFALTAVLAEFALSIFLVLRFDSTFAGYQLVERREWIPALRISYHLGVDGLSLWLVLLTTFITPVAIAASWRSITKHVREFFLM
ncbi:MAG TPA: hypothetical protein VGA40_09635, partial [Candidatus Acidoferrales bacterium]